MLFEYGALFMLALGLAAACGLAAAAGLQFGTGLIFAPLRVGRVVLAFVAGPDAPFETRLVVALALAAAAAAVPLLGAALLLRRRIRIPF